MNVICPCLTPFFCTLCTLARLFRVPHTASARRHTAHLTRPSPPPFLLPPQFLVPVVQEAVVGLPDLLGPLLYGVAATGNNSSGIVVAKLASAVATSGDCPGKEAVLAAVNTGAVSFAQLTAPGMMRIKKVKAALEEAGDAFRSGIEYRVISAVADKAGDINDVAESADGADALTAWVNELPADVRACPSFARALVSEAVFAACNAGDIAAGVANAAAPLTAAVASAVEAAAGDEGKAAAIGAFVLSGAQVAAASDEGFAPEAGEAVFKALQAPGATGFGVVKQAGFKAWLTAAPPASGAPLPLSVAEPVGRDLAKNGEVKAKIEA